MKYYSQCPNCNHIEIIDCFCKWRITSDNTNYYVCCSCGEASIIKLWHRSYDNLTALTINLPRRILIRTS